MVERYLVTVLPLLLWITKTEQTLQSSMLMNLMEEFRGTLQDAETNVLNQQSSESLDDMPPAFQMDSNFTHAFRPNTGIGNRENLIIKQVREVTPYSDSNFFRWRYIRFNNSDYILGMNLNELRLWKSINPISHLDLSLNSAVFRTSTQYKSNISDAIFFTRRYHYVNVMYIAMLTENGQNSFINIYQIIDERVLMVTMINLGFSINGYYQYSSNFLADVQFRHKDSLVVLVPQSLNGPKVVYREEGSSTFNHYVEIHYPSPVDMVTFAVAGHGYIAVANKTSCVILRMNEFVKGHKIFQRFFIDDIVDLEYFRMGFNHYLIISTTTVSNVYVWTKGGFASRQVLPSKGLLQAYGALLPNCRDDVILMLIKANAQPDLLIWQGQVKQFVQVNITLPHNFVLRPGTITSYSFGATAFLLFSNFAWQAHLFAIDTQLDAVPDPILKTGEEISSRMKRLQVEFNQQEAMIRNMSSVLKNAVRSTGTNHFGALQVFKNLHSTESIVTDIRTRPLSVVWEGSLITMDDYLAGTADLELKMDTLEATLSKLELILPDIVLVDEPAVITGPKTFTGRVEGSSVFAQSLNIDHVADVNVKEIQKQLYRIDRPSPIEGTVEFMGDLHVHGNLDIGIVNGIDINKDVMTTNTDQVSYAEMNFNKLSVHGDLTLTGKLNDIDIGNEVVTLSGNHVITGNKTFLGGIIAGNVQADIIDGVNVNYLLMKSLTINGKQTITNTKHFTGTFQTQDIKLIGTLNSYDVKELASNIIRIDTPSTISGHKTFVDNLIINNSLMVDGKVNGLKIPEDLVLKDKPNLITGLKTFLGTVTAKDVMVHGTVNGLDLPKDIITLSKNETIHSKLHFKSGISAERNIIVHGLVDGVDISELAKDALKLNETNEIKNAEFQGEVIVNGDIFINGFINGISLEDLIADIVFYSDEEVIITGPKFFSTVFADKVELKGTLNGYDIQNDFMTVRGDQFINGTKTFENAVTFQSLTTGDGLLDGINLTHLYQNRVSLSIEDQVIDGDVEFVDHVVISGDLTVHGTLGGYRFPKDFVLKTGDQEIKEKEFRGPLIIDNLLVVGDVNVKDKFGSLNLTAFFDQRITLSKNEDIYGDIILGDASVKRLNVSGLVNGLNIVEFANNVMSLTKNQTITAYKEFSGSTKVYGSVTTIDGINGIRLSDVNKRAFKLVKDTTIATPVTFSDPVIFKDLFVNGLINEVNLTQLDAESVKIKGLQYVAAETMFHKGFHVEGNILTTNINGLNLGQDILTKNTPQTIKGSYTFSDVSVGGNMQVSGLVNGIDLGKTAPLLAKNDGPNTIYSNLVFKAPVHVAGNIDVSGLVNGLNLTEIAKTAMLKTEYQNIPGHKILKGNVTVYGDVDVTFVNDILWKGFLEDVIRIDVPRTITSPKVWSSDMEVKGDVYISGFAQVEKLNNVSLAEFIKDAVFIHQPAHITGTKVFSNPVEITGDLNADLINGLNLKKDIIILQCGDEPQVITGEKTFRNLTVRGDIIVDGFVNGYKLPDVVANTLTIDGDQNITGHKVLHNPVTFMKNVYTNTVNGLVLRQDLVTLDTEQEIHGNFFFKDHIVVKDLITTGLINGIDIEKLSKEILYSDTEQDIEGVYTIENAVVKSHVFVDGLINGINLHMLSQNVTEFWKESQSELDSLMDKTSYQCEKTENLYNFLERSYYILDGFLLHQVLNFSSDYSDIKLDTGYMSLIRIRNTGSLADVQRYRLNYQSETFDYVDAGLIDAVKQKVYHLPGRELIIRFGVESKASGIFLAGKRITAITSAFFDGDAIILKERIILALLPFKSSICEIFEIDLRNSTLEARPFGNIKINGATSVILFEMYSTPYLALSCDSSPSFKENSKLYVYMKKDWHLAQNIPASASSRVLHFPYHGYHYLVFTNAVPVFKTKEPMAIQVYRNTESDSVPFGLFQKISFDNAKTLETFKFGDLEELYLVTSNKTEVGVFRLEGESGFNTKFILHGKCILSVKPFILENKLYLVISQKDKTFANPAVTEIYKGLTQGWSIPSKEFKHCS